MKLPQWTKESDIAIAKRHKISTSIISVTSPGAANTNLKPEEAAKLARQMNEYAAKMRDGDPSSYGFYVNLPSILDKEATLMELAHGLDVLKADGVCLFTRYGTGHQYLGHPGFQYLWEELDRRSAVVFVHPIYPVDTQLVNPILVQPMLDFTFETTRAAMDLITSKTMRNFKNIKVILSHGGGALPYLIERPASIIPYMISEREFNTQDMIEDARNFYFDTALSSGHNTLVVLQQFAKPGHILFGSDFPYAPPPTIEHHIQALDNYHFSNPRLLQEINKTNALALFPRLAKYQK